jgi:aminopeptidase N
MNRSLLLGALLLACAPSAQAQPFQYGCHWFRQQAHPNTLLSAADRELIDDIIARSDTFDILHYDIAMDVTNVGGQQIQAATTIRYAALMADQAFIRFELQGLEVDSVTSSSGPLAFLHDGAVLRVNFAAAPAVGATDSLTVHYHGHPQRDPEWGGFYFESGYVYNLGIGLTTIPPNFGKVWYPCFDSFVERATYTYHVKSAGGYKAHCQGTFLGETQLGGDTVVRSFNMAQTMTTHLSAIAVAAYQDSDFVHTGAYGDIPVRLTAKPAQLGAMVGKFGDIGAAIDACEHWYGAYPWERVGYVLTTDGALEIPTNIAYPDFMTSQSVADNRALFTHELGHHWWGDIVAPRTQNDMWMKEGPAEYSGHLVEEWIGGEAAFVKAVKDNQLFVLRNAHIQDGGFLPLSPMPDAEIYGLHTYYKGAAVMHDLRGYLGDSLFRVGMSQVQTDQAYSALDAAGFRDALEAATGQDLHPFFDNEVYNPGFAVFVPDGLSSTPAGAQWNTQLQIKQKLRGTTAFHHQVPLDVTFIGAGGERQEAGMIGDGEISSADFLTDFPPVLAVLNGHNRLNQARMDHEDTLVPGVSPPISQPYVDFQLYMDNITDTTWIRLEHVWAGADPGPLGFGVDSVTTTHYWTVEGLWPEGTAMHAKVNYDGSDATDLDFALYGESEENAALVYRAGPGDPWEIYPDQTVQALSTTDGVGSIKIDVLRRGQYAFAKAPGSIGIEEQGPLAQLAAWPVPADRALHVQLPVELSGALRCLVHTVGGRLVKSMSLAADATGQFTFSTAELPAGAYVLRVQGAGGAAGNAHFSVAR